MHVAIEGCCHGELDAIYASIARAEREKGFKVDLLLICGDFQALRNPYDFESLAVPEKFRALGSFHSYYSGQKTAPILTIVIGGNHEASNYMWELYHGGWLAPNIYYLGTAGSVLVNGMRISGASGIYKSHDYHKGHFETMPFDRSTMRSIYHIRHLSVSKLLLLPPSSSSSEPDQQASTSTSPSPFPPQTHPSIFISHDWPLSIAPHGDLPTLLRRKPFFADEIRDNTLGSKPLLQVLKVLKPRWWFAAHLHVKFAAIWRHDSKGREEQPALQAAGEGVGEVRNPDEIVLEDEDEGIGAGAGNPDEIKLDDEEEEIDAAADKVEKVETKEVMDDADVSSKGKAADMVNPDEITLEDDGDDEVPHTHLPPPSSTLPSRPPPEVLTTTPSSSSPPDQEQGLVTKFLALDKCLPNKDYLQILEIPTPVANPSSSPSSTSSSPSTSTSSPSTPNLTYDPYWLAITRALHPFLALSARQGPLPSPEQLKKLVEKELDWVETNGMGFAENGFEGKKAVGEVQRFWRTAPCVGEAGGGPDAWYTNPQTLAFCSMLDIPNKINPVPPGFPLPPPTPAELPPPFWPPGYGPPLPTAPHPFLTEAGLIPSQPEEDSPMALVNEEGGSEAKRSKLSLPEPVHVQEEGDEDEEDDHVEGLLTLGEEDEAGRWKEGSG